MAKTLPLVWVRKSSGFDARWPKLGGEFWPSWARANWAERGPVVRWSRPKMISIPPTDIERIRRDLIKGDLYSRRIEIIFGGRENGGG
jgi:hypothetical protein